MILLDPKKIMRFTVDVTNAHDKECLADMAKALITGKAIRAGICAKLLVKLDMAIHGSE